MTHPKHVAARGKLDVDQGHQLIRLLAEARETPAERPERERHLVSGVARIVGAVIAGAVFDPDATPDHLGQHSGTMLFESRDTGLASLEVQTQFGSTFDPTIRAMMQIAPSDPGTAVTATWNELASDGWCGSEHPACTVNAVFSSVHLRTPSHVHGLGLYREPGDRAFSEEERNLVYLFHSECGGLLHVPLRDGDDDPVRARLPPRQRQTLQLMLTGLCDKEIAESLGISRYTVNQYTKAIYRQYTVTSRAQLLARLLGQRQTPYSLIVGIGIVATLP